MLILNMSLSAYYMKNEMFVVNEVDESIIIFDSDYQETYVLNFIERSIWNHCDGVHTFSDIICKMKEQYDSDQEEIEEDVREFLIALLEKNIIVEQK